MTANSSVYQFVHLKQPSCNYLSQVYQISYHLTDLKEAIEELLFSINVFLKSGHKTLDRNLIPVGDLLALNVAQTQAIEMLRQAANEIETYSGFEDYLNAYAQLEVKHA